jgi:hypothetical protein
MRLVENRGREGFNGALALADAVPVALFAAGSNIAAELLGSPLFTAGSNLSTAAGACKTAWKLLLSDEKDVPALNGAFHILMPAGFALMLAGALSAPHASAALLLRFCCRPQRLWFAAGTAGLAVMGVFAKKLDGDKAWVNWLEEAVNTASQGALFVGALISR